MYHGGTDSELVKSVMTPRQLLSPQARAALFDPPTDLRAIVRHYTFSIEDLALIRQRRRNANRFGFAVLHGVKEQGLAAFQSIEMAPVV